MKILDFIDKNDKGYFGALVDIANAFAYDGRVRKEIDKIYEANKYTYYRIAKKSKAYNDYSITMAGITNEIYSKRALGILLCAEDDLELTRKLIEIIKRYYFDIYICIKSNSEENYKNLANKIIESEFIPAISRTYEAFIAYLILKLNNDGQALISIYDNFLNDYFETRGANYLADIDTKDKINEDKELIKGIIKRIFENKGKFYGYEDLYNIKDMDINKYIKIITAIFDFEKISASRLLSHIQLTEDDLEEIILSYTYIYRDKNLERSSNVLINGVLIKSMIKAYKEVRETFIENNKETLYFNMEELEDRIKSLENENCILKEELANSNKKVSALLESNKKDSNELRKIYEKQISQLNKKLADVNKMVSIESKKNEELIKLREMFFQVENDYTIEETRNTIDNFTAYKKILVVGGTQEWRKKIKEKYNELLTLDGFNENFDKSILNNIDYIFFFAGCMNHATYYRVINYIRNNEVPFGYIGKTNIELIEAEMVQELEKSFC